MTTNTFIWWKSKLAWTIIIAGIVAMAGAFILAYFLPLPYNIIVACIACVPSGIVIRKSIIKALESSAIKGKN